MAAGGLRLLAAALPTVSLVDASTHHHEAAHLKLTVDNTRQTGAGGFSGYEVTALSGTQGGETLSLVGPTLAGFNGVSNGNLFNIGSPNFFSSGGLGYEESGGEPYQLFFSAADDQSEGCWSHPSPCVVPQFVAKRFHTAVTPLPSAWPLFATALVGLALVGSRRSVRAKSLTGQTC